MAKGIKKKTERKEQVSNNFYVTHDKNYIYIKDNKGNIKDKKVYRQEEYAQDKNNAKYWQSFKEHKKTTIYGKKVTWRSSNKTQRYYKLDDTKDNTKIKYVNQKTLNQSEYFIVICEGTFHKKGQRSIPIVASSKRHKIGETSREQASQEATENFYMIAYGKITGETSDYVPKQYEDELSKNVTIERYYISYR